MILEQPGNLMLVCELLRKLILLESKVNYSLKSS